MGKLFDVQKISTKKRRSRKALSDSRSISHDVSHSSIASCASEKLKRQLLTKRRRLKTVLQQLRRLKQEKKQLLNRSQRPAAEQCMEIMEREINSEKSSITPAAALLLQQQFKAYLLTDSHGMSWNRKLVDWALQLKVTSAAAFIVESGAVRLPAPATLSRYLSKLPKCAGFNDPVITDMINEYLTLCPQPYAKYLTLSLDEMKIKANLVYDKKSELIVGYVDSTEMINALNETDSSIEDSQKIATDVLVVYVRSIAAGYEKAIAWFPVRRLSACEIMSIVWTSKRKLEFLSFKEGQPRLKVVSVTCDGLAANHLFFKLHSRDRDQLQYKAVDPFDQDNFLYFMIDPPHLLKTIRNNTEKSSATEEATKCLENNGRPILWNHWEAVYLEDEANVWRLLPQLSHRHIYLTPSDRMKVKLAAQVLSKRMSLALDVVSEMKESATLCRNVNRMFDMLNGRYPAEHRHRLNPDLATFSSATDYRLDWLKEECLSYFQSWENNVKAMDLPNSEKERRLLSRQTRAGIFITINGFVECVRWLLSQPDAPPYILSGVFNQDRLEIYFGHVRCAGGSNDHPDWKQFQRIASVLNFVKSAKMKAKRGGNIS